MFGIDDVIGVGLKILDKVIQDPAQREVAKLELLKQQQTGTLDELRISMSAILGEAQSADPWTRRARPTFLYLMYGVIAAAFAGGILGIWFPAQVTQAADNIGRLLGAIPESLWWLFGVGYLGYTGARSFDKWRGAGR
jgi:hypothetical protein